MITKRGYFILACVIFLSLVNQARAQATATGTMYATRTAGNSETTASGYFSTLQAACAASASNANTFNPSGAPHTSSVVVNTPVQNSTCFVNLANGSAYYNGSFSTQAGTYALGCPASGETRTRNFTLGYSNTPNDSTDMTGITIPSGEQCITGGGATCTGTPGAIKNVWASLTPNAQGLYRVSGDFEVTFTGATCTPGAAEKTVTDTEATPATCPGAYGTVGGKPTCVPSSLAERNVIQSIMGKTATAGNPSAGSDASRPYGDRVPTSGGTGNNDGSSPSATDGKSLGSAGLGVPATTGTTSTNSSGSTPTEPQQTDCEKNPSSIGCSEYGSVTNETLSTSDSGFNSIGSVSLASASGCPSPESFSVAGHQYAVSFQPVCNGADSYIKPVMIVLGAALAAFIFIGGFKA